MTITDYQNDIKYCNELIKYIHSEIGGLNVSNDEIHSLMKEHKRATESLNSSYVIETFASGMNMDKLSLAKLKILKQTIEEDFTVIYSRKRQVFSHIATHILKIHPNKITCFLGVRKRRYYVYLSKFKELKENHLVKKEYKTYINKYNLHD